MRRKISKTRNRVLRAHQWYLFLIFFLPTCFVLLQFIIQFSSGIVITQIMQSLSLNTLRASILASSYYYIYTLMQAPAGALVERLGPRFILSIGALICAAGALLFMLATHLFMAVIGRVLMGFGMSCGFVSALFLYRNWFSTRAFVLLICLLEAFALVFTGLGNIFIAKIIIFIGWRHYVGILILSALLLSALIFATIRNTRERHGKLRPLISSKSPSHHFFRDMKILFTHPAALINGLYSGIMISPQTVFVSLWGIPFLMNYYHLTLMQSTIACSSIFIAAAIGAPFAGTLYTKTTYHRPFMAAAAVIASLIFFLFILIKLPYWLLLVACFSLGLTASLYMWTYVIVQDLVPAVAASTGIGFTNMFCLGVAPMTQLLISMILHALNGHRHHGLFVAHAYQFSLALMPLMMLIIAGLILIAGRHRAIHIARIA